MGIEDLYTALTTIGIFLAGMAADHVQTLVKHFVWGPRVSLRFDHRTPGCIHETALVIGWDTRKYLGDVEPQRRPVTLPKDKWTPCTYLRIQANARGWFPAKDCRAYLTRLRYRQARSEVWQIDVIDNFPLPWSYQGREPRTIFKGGPGFIDLIEVRDDSHHLQLDAIQAVYAEALSGHEGVYELTVTVVADGMAASSKTVHFVWKGSRESMECWSSS